MKKKHFILLILILAIGIFFRFYLIGKMPGGLFPDEAANGLDINSILNGHAQPFYQRGNGREALFFYLLAASVHFFGRGFWQHHIVSAAIGVISIFACYLLAARLYNHRTALLASFFMAVNAWHVVLSRTAFRAIQIPVFTAFTLYFMVRTVQARSKIDQYISAILSGAFFAGGFYTYISYRMMPVILLVIIALLLLNDKKQSFAWTKQYWKPFVVAVISAVIVFYPLGKYFVQHPGTFVGRSGQVSVFNSDLNHGHLAATVVNVFKKSVEAFFMHGDLNWRQNISGDPFLSPLISPFFGIALLVMMWLTIKFIYESFKPQQANIEHLKYAIPVAMFWGMLVPVVATAEGIPHGLRSIGAIPYVFIISAVGIMYMVEKFLKLWHYKWMEIIYWLAAAAFLFTLAFTTYTSYFIYAYNNPDNFYAFRSDLSTVSDYLNSRPDKAHTYLVLDLFSLQTVDYLTTITNNPYIVVDPANSYKLHIHAGDKIVFTQSTLFDTIKFQQYHPNVQVDALYRNKFGTPDMIVYKAAKSDKSISLGANSSLTFTGLNLGDKVYWSWQNVSFDPWKIQIWQCIDPECKDRLLVKENNQNDYLSTNDYINIDGTKKDLYYTAIAFDAKRNIIDNFGVIKLEKYK